MNIARFYQRFRASVICVRDGAVIHKGLIHSVTIAGPCVTIWIMDNNPDRGSVGYRTLEDFAKGQTAWLENPVQSWQQAEAIIARAESQFGRLYDMLTFNCEHFITLALGNEPESRQLQGFAWLAAGVAAAILIAANSQPRRRQR
jgi:hypothetical protein